MGQMTHTRLVVPRKNGVHLGHPVSLFLKGIQDLAGRVAIFIDGGYLDAVLRDEFGGARINYSALAQKLRLDSDILRTYYYHCPLIQSNAPTQEESRRYSGQLRFFKSLNGLPRFSVRLGKLARRGTHRDGTPRYEQKRVDILLSVDLVQLAAKQVIQNAILVAGDSDFIPAIEAAKSEGVVVHVFHGENIHSDLWQEADERSRITQELVDSIIR